ncbi:hypothetical protein ACWGJ2_37390 [Streptomyces sp. NPDC054796]
MTGPASHPRVFHPQAPVQAGNGDQYVSYVAFLDAVGLRTGTPGKDPREIAQDELLQLKRLFVYPPGTYTARETLEQRGTVLLTGTAGSGKRATATVLLTERPGGTGSFHELLDQSEEGEGLALDPDHVGDGDQLLLDLSASEETALGRILAELPSFRATVRRRNARLAVVLPPDRDHLLGDELQRLVARIRRPEPWEVLRRHLLTYGIRPSESELSSGKLSAFLSREPLRRVGALAVHVRDARDASTGTDGFREWAGKALEAVFPSGPQLTRRIQSLKDGQQRALLLASAFLPSARSDAVYYATVNLLRAAQHPAEDPPLLEHASLASRLSAIGAELDTQNRVQLPAGYDEAVRVHCWNNFPPLRETLRRWVSDAAVQQWITTDERMGLVERYATESLRTGPPADLRKLVEEWTGSVPDRVCRPAATYALQKAVVHERYGRTFRRMIYDWAYSSTSNVPLAEVLVGICAESLAGRFPDQAMTRLHYLARHRNSRVRAAAREALFRLVRPDGRLYRRLLDRLTPGTDALPQHDIDLFLQIADPALLIGPGSRAKPLITGPVVRSQLTVGWASVLENRSRSVWTGRVRGWLDTACARPSYRDALLDVLIDACRGNARALSRLYVIVRDWARTDDDALRTPRAETLGRFWHKNSAALGLETPLPTS